MKNKLSTIYEEMFIITNDNESQLFLAYCLNNNIETNYITQRDHFFIITKGIPIGGKYNTNGYTFNVSKNENNKLKKQRQYMFFKEFAKSAKLINSSFMLYQYLFLNTNNYKETNLIKS